MNEHRLLFQIQTTETRKHGVLKSDVLGVSESPWLICVSKIRRAK